MKNITSDDSVFIFHIYTYFGLGRIAAYTNTDGYLALILCAEPITYTLHLIIYIQNRIVVTTDT